MKEEDQSSSCTSSSDECEDPVLSAVLGTAARGAVGFLQHYFDQEGCAKSLLHVKNQLKKATIYFLFPSWPHQ